ncbi:mitochondrial PPR repeat protein Ppr10 [Schizosaccharomyces osmophilus]|uniref:Mitochondrial PPR repeat protein Ppr10 n=1 Tax=Schizosaccharomyces osmophilus TaxID=2545709 RepID=A0AAE9WH39_9SCHI|nr:mitochondrial PPR repeat protein Ppr10 [Schizosaccharomyces osmophilus]WBW75625.1 mitochondrial PPR repeat protein Ppr10 [Schizosaccharomyces osmophilus]
MFMRICNRNGLRNALFASNLLCRNVHVHARSLENKASLSTLEKLNTHPERMKFFSSIINETGSSRNIDIGDLITSKSNEDEVHDVLNQYGHDHSLLTSKFFKKATSVAEKKQSGELASRLREIAANSMMALSPESITNLLWVFIREKNSYDMMALVSFFPNELSVYMHTFRRLLLTSTRTGTNVDTCYFLAEILLPDLLKRRHTYSIAQQRELQKIYYELLLCFAYSYHTKGMKFLLPILYQENFQSINATSMDMAVTALCANHELEAAIQLTLYLAKRDFPVNYMLYQEITDRLCFENKPLLALKFFQNFYKGTHTKSTAEFLMPIAESLYKQFKSSTEIENNLSTFLKDASKPTHAIISRLIMLSALFTQDLALILRYFTNLRSKRLLTLVDYKIVFQLAFELRSLELADAISKEGKHLNQSDQFKLRENYIALQILVRKYAEAIGNLELLHKEGRPLSKQLLLFALHSVKKNGTEEDFKLLQSILKRLGYDFLSKNLDTPKAVAYRCLYY